MWLLIRALAREKGLVTIARFLICADSAVLISRKPIRMQVLNLSCDKYACMRDRARARNRARVESGGFSIDRTVKHENMAHDRHTGRLKLVQTYIQETRHLQKIRGHRHLTSELR